MYLKHTWLPASPPDILNPLKIVQANGAYLIADNGQAIYDAISSWWCKPLGHGHHIVKDSIYEQLKYFEHHIPANTYNDVIEELSSELVKLCPGMDKVVYASDGSSAVEIAMKLSYESRAVTGQKQRTKFIALKGAYHGETIFTLSVCGIEAYTTTYTNLLVDNYFIDEIIYVNSRDDPLWHKCTFDEQQLADFLAVAALNATALIIEPIVQGANGLKIISRDFLVRLIAIARKYDLHIISDEIMVGLGRLGCLCVSDDMLGFVPDFICLAKNLTAGSIPMSAVVVSLDITDIFRRYKQSFAHSHTHSCNALGARVALNYLKFLHSTTLLADVSSSELKLFQLVQKLAAEFTWIENPRAIGAIAACELTLGPIYVNQIFSLGLQCGIYLRPINNTLYIMPPLYNINHDLGEIECRLYAVLSLLDKSI